MYSAGYFEHPSSHFIQNNPLRGWGWEMEKSSYFINEKTEAQKGKITWLSYYRQLKTLSINKNLGQIF